MKHIALALLGWYLLLPPWVSPYHVNMNAPYSQWKSGANNTKGPCAFPSFQACAAYKTQVMTALKDDQVKFTNTSGLSQATLLDWNWRVYWNGRCIEK